MKLIGLTGGVGMGKSTTAQILSGRDISLVDSDVLARRVVEPGQPALKEIRETFGDTVVAPDGQLRRNVLAKIVFSDAAARQKLEGITHPRIRALWKQEADLWRTQQKPMGVVVIPLLFETNAEKEFDTTICIACPAATQWKRLEERGWTSEQIDQRIAAQLPIEKKIAKADFVVWNEGSLEILSAQLDRILSFRTEPVQLSGDSSEKPATQLSKEEQWALFEKELRKAIGAISRVESLTGLRECPSGENFLERFQF